MLCKLKTNLGSSHAAKLGVDFRECVIDAEVSVDDIAGKWLVENGIATDITPPKPEPKLKPEPKPEPVPEPESKVEMKAVPTTDMQTSEGEQPEKPGKKK